MKKILLTLFFFGCTSPAFAALTTAQWIAADASQARYLSALTVTDNIAPAMSAGVLNGYNTQIGNFLKDAVKLSRPVSATAEVVAPLAVAIGSPGAKIIARKALGLLGPIAIALQVGMTAKDIYDAARANPTLYPLTYDATNVDPLLGQPYAGMPQGTTFNSPFGVRVTTNPGSYNGCVANDIARDNGPIAYWSADLTSVYGSQGSGCSGTGSTAWTYNSAPGSQPIPVPANPVQFETNILTAPTSSNPGIYSPQLIPELDKIQKSALDFSNATIMPSPKQITDLSKLPEFAVPAATTATATAVQTAQTNYDLNPTPENKQKLDELLAQQATAIANQSKEDALIAPGLPDNIYDTTIIAPDKKSIPELLASFVASSPLVSMVRSFTMTTTGGSCSVPIGLIYGQQMSFDFCRWEPYLVVVGGLLILIMSGFSVLVVIRGW